MSASKRACIALAVTLIVIFLLQNNAAANSRREDVQTRNLSRGDRLSCRWLGLCGLSHIEEGNFPRMDEHEPGHALYESQHGQRDQTVLNTWKDTEKSGDASIQEEPKDVPQYVLDHAPLVHLFSEELYWPSDITEHLKHITPTFKYDPVEESRRHPTVNNLEELNALDGNLGWKMYLQSNDNIEDMPAWLTSEYGIPVFPDDDDYVDTAPLGSPPQKRDYRVGGRSSAPVILMVIDKGNGVVDAMWHFFYSYNLGNGVFGIRFGNHVGDWEHTVVRFVNGTPAEMFLSEHAGGVSYTFEAMEKDSTGQRPVIYSAVGTHAMYAKPGLHPYIIPFGILKDQTDKGPLWDPALNYYGYTYTPDSGHDVGVRWLTDDPAKFSNKTDTLHPTSNNPWAPTSWFHFSGHWGDKYYPLSDPRQYRFFSEWAHVSGPPGPKFKAPGRPNICFKEKGACRVLNSIEPLNWFLQVAWDWLVVSVIVWLIVVLLWGCARGVRRCCCCCSGRGRGEGGRSQVGGERRPLLTGASMSQPIGYGGVGRNRRIGGRS